LNPQTFCAIQHISQFPLPTCHYKWNGLLKQLQHYTVTWILSHSFCKLTNFLELFIFDKFWANAVSNTVTSMPQKFHQGVTHPQYVFRKCQKRMILQLKRTQFIHTIRGIRNNYATKCERCQIVTVNQEICVMLTVHENTTLWFHPLISQPIRLIFTVLARSQKLVFSPKLHPTHLRIHFIFMSDHLISSNNRSLSTNKKTNQLLEKCLIFMIRTNLFTINRGNTKHSQIIDTPVNENKFEQNYILADKFFDHHKKYSVNRSRQLADTFLFRVVGILTWEKVESMN
jgi:hypothetical protein